MIIEMPIVQLTQLVRTKGVWAKIIYSFGLAEALLGIGSNGIGT